MSYKVGDKVLCKKNHGNVFISDKYYTVSKVSDVNYNYKEDFAIYILEGDFISGFDFKEYEGYTFSDLFGNIFYTKEEERKFKLERLNEI